VSNLAIRCESLAKQYRIGQRESYRALRDTLTDKIYAPFRAAGAIFKGGGNGRPANAPPTIFALKDISFEVRAGEVVGIIGHNGAGKSTLLKILSRITRPTRGCAEIYGRVGSLLEVGTGFHPELTGRENVYLNGAILGMSRAEIERKFAEIEDFIDTPVKRYSSGMYVRLAFAVAAHLETEVLLVDEVLAVGDAQFQKKCFQRMRQISSGGRTILFVSHNMAALRHICEKGVVLHRGAVLEVGEINRVIDGYLSRVNADTESQGVVETESFVVEEVRIGPRESPLLKTFDDVEIWVRFRAKTRISDPGLYVGVLTLDHQRIAGLDFKDFATATPVSAGEVSQLGFCVQDFPLLPGCYQLELHLKDMAAGTIEIVPQTFPFEVVETPVYNGRKLDRWFGVSALHATPLVMTAEGHSADE
jgi:lipopolysaccharide transport system ATP-binding protein